MIECNINGLKANAVIDYDFANEFTDLIVIVDRSLCCDELKAIIENACFSGEYLPMSITNGIECISFTGLFTGSGRGDDVFMVQSACEIKITYYGTPVDELEVILPLSARTITFSDVPVLTDEVCDLKVNRFINKPEVK